MQVVCTKNFHRRIRYEPIICLYLHGSIHLILISARVSLQNQGYSVIDVYWSSTNVILMVAVIGGIRICVNYSTYSSKAISWALASYGWVTCPL